MDLFDKRKLLILNDITSLREIYARQGENEALIKVQEAQILEEIQALIQNAKPEDAYGWIERIRGMIKNSYWGICWGIEQRKDFRKGD